VLHEIEPTENDKEKLSQWKFFWTQKLEQKRMAEEAARQLNQFRKTPEEQLEKYLKHNKPVFRKGDKPMTFFKSFKVSFNKVKDLIKDSNLH